MEWLTSLLSSPSLRRAAAAAVTMGVLALNKRAGLNLDVGEIAGIVTTAVAYLAQSAAMDKQRVIAEANAAGAAAAEKVKTVHDAAAVLAPAPEVKP